MEELINKVDERLEKLLPKKVREDKLIKHGVRRGVESFGVLKLSNAQYKRMTDGSLRRISTA